MDIRETAEQTLVGDFNRNNRMSLEKHILFSRLRLITLCIQRFGSRIAGAACDWAG